MGCEICPKRNLNTPYPFPFPHLRYIRHCMIVLTLALFTPVSGIVVSPTLLFSFLEIFSTFFYTEVIFT